MHHRRAGRHDDTIEALFPDVIADEVLPRFGAHELVVARDADPRQICDVLPDLLDVNGSGDIRTAVSDVEADLAGSLVAHLRLPS